MNRIWQARICRPLLWLLAVIEACLVAPYAIAQYARPEKPGLAQTAVPAGPYASWPDEQKRTALAALQFRCTLVGVMQVGNYGGPKEAGAEYAQVVAAACIDGQMPDDWPGRAELLESQKRHFELAHQLDDSLKMPPPGWLR
jgi:hypothetical protein